MLICQATPSDQAAVLEILVGAREWLHAKGIRQWPIPFTPGWVAERLERREFFVAKVEDQVAGVFRLLDTDPQFWGERTDRAVYVHSLAVQSSFHGRRLGAELLGWIERWSVENHRSAVRLDCLADNPALCSYYAKAGFTPGPLREVAFGDHLYRGRLFEKPVGTERNP